MKKKIKTIKIILCFAFAIAAVCCLGCLFFTVRKLDSKIGAQQKTIDELENTLAESEESGGGADYYEYYEEYVEVHEIYDDTAVIEAYKSGDASALTDEKDVYILEAASEAIDEIITEDMSDYEKELAVYDYIQGISRFDEGNLSAIPDTEDYSHTPYGVLHDGTAICVGNAVTFKLFMDMLDIGCMVIHSTEEGEHAWDLVNIGEGWYHVDITFDGGDPGSPTYSRFNVTDDVKLRDGYYWNTEEFPEACETEYNYAVINSEDIEDIYEVAGFIGKKLEDRENGAYFRFEMPDGAETSYLNLVLEAVGDSVMQSFGYESFYIEFMPGTESDGFFCCGFAIVYYDDGYGYYTEEPEDYSGNSYEIDFDRLNETIVEQFGSGFVSSYLSYYGLSDQESVPAEDGEEE